MLDRTELLDKLADPDNAKVGDYILIHVENSTRFVEIARLEELISRNEFRVDTRKSLIRYSDTKSPSKHWKKRYIESLRLLSYPLVGPFRPESSIPKFSVHADTSVVGRPKLIINIESVKRTASNYIDIRLNIKNESNERAIMTQHQWDGEQIDRDSTPFAYQSLNRHNVYTVAGYGHSFIRTGSDVSYPGEEIPFRISVCKRAELAAQTRVFIPSAIFGGAIGTYTTIVINAPPCLST